MLRSVGLLLSRDAAITDENAWAFANIDKRGAVRAAECTMHDARNGIGEVVMCIRRVVD